MQRKVKPMPPGYHTVTLYSCVNGAASAILFYEIMRMPGPGHSIGHAEIQIEDSRIIAAGGARLLYYAVDILHIEMNVNRSDEHPDMNFRGPHSFGGDMPDVSERVFQRAPAVTIKLVGLRVATVWRASHKGNVST